MSDALNAHPLPSVQEEDMEEQPVVLEAGDELAAAAASHGPAPVEQVLERLTAIEASLAEFHQRSVHREAVIDRLHQDNQELRTGERRTLLDPVVADLIRLHDALQREVARLQASSDGMAPLFESFGNEVELILDRCGVEAFSAGPGDTYRPGEHRPLAVVPTDRHDLHNTVAEAVTRGFRDRTTRRVRRPAAAHFHKLQEPPDPPVT